MKKFLIGLLVLSSASVFAESVVVKKYGVYIPADLGKKFICYTDLQWGRVVMGYYSEKGVFSLSTSLAVEKVGAIFCDNNKSFTLVNMDMLDERGNELKIVYAVNNENLLN